MVVVAAMLWGMSGCNTMPDGSVPIYVRIDSPTVTTAGTLFGSASNRIPTVWATTGAHNLGAYEMPINIPVLSEGAVPMAVSAGIYDNGIISAQAQYPFYAPDTFTIPNAIPGHLYIHHPIYHYYTYTQIGLNCDFESGNSFTNVSTFSELPTSDPDSIVYEGYHSGGIIMTPSDTAITAYQTNGVTISTNGRESYIELNWKINNPNVFCDVGVIATLYSGGQISEQTTEPILTLTAFGAWRKTYLNCDNFIGSNQGYTFQIYFTAYNSAGQQDTVFLDNIKLLYFH
jgi:hypothetical protein